MTTFAKARRLAEAWVDIMCDGEAELVRHAVIAKPYGWVFFYQSKDFLRNPADLAAQLAGNSPFVVDRVNAEIWLLGTALPVEEYLGMLEKKLPPARLLMAPELPSW